MPKTRLENVFFTIIMATFMVYGMVVYNVAIATGNVDGSTFIEALKELPIMVPIAFILEFFIIGNVAKKLALKVMSPAKYPELFKYVMSICICIIMCPIMSFIATILFNELTLGTWIKAWAMNLPMALLYQLCYCGPVVRALFGRITAIRDSIREKKLSTNV